MSEQIHQPREESQCYYKYILTQMLSDQTSYKLIKRAREK